MTQQQAERLKMQDPRYQDPQTKRPEHSVEPDRRPGDKGKEGVGDHEVDAPAERPDDETVDKTTVRQE